MGNNHLEVNRKELTFTMTRVIDAPQKIVWEAWTEPDQISQWWGQKSSTTIVDKMDVRVGGEWRYIEKDSEGNEYAFRGVYKEIMPYDRLTYTFEFEPMAGHITTDALTLEETEDGKTRMTSKTTCDRIEDLDGLLQSGMEDGATESWDQLETFVTKNDHGKKNEGITMQKINTCLWFDNQAEEAIHFYVSLFKNSKIKSIKRIGENDPGTTGKVLNAIFQLDGQEYMAIDGGPQFPFTEAISLNVNCETQEEVDRLWEKLSEGGEEVQCGWLKDKYGLSWQIVPTVLGELLSDPDPEKANRVMQAMLQMKKLDIDTLKQAYEG